MTAPRGKRVIRFLGWLLTPVVVWAASFLGGWAVALATSTDRGTIGIVQMTIGAMLGGTVGLVGWLVVMRRGREDRDAKPPDAKT